MKIIRLMAENVKGIRAIQIEPKDDVVPISGKNGAGKSSVLDTIEALLLRDTPLPLRQGAERGYAAIDMGEFVITRTVTDTKDSLVVRGKDGKPVSSPREFVSKYVGDLTIDPLTFVRMGQKEQVAALFRVVPNLKAELDRINGKLAKIALDRSDALRDGKRVAVEIEQMGNAEGAPEVEVSISELTRSVAEITARNQERAKQRSQMAAWEQDVFLIREKAQSIKDKILSLQVELEQVEESASNAQTRIDNYGTITPDEEIAPTMEKIAQAETQNALFRRAKKLSELTTRREDLRKTYSDLGFAAKAAEKEKTEVLATGGLPVPGLGISDEGVTFNGVQLSECSTSQKLAVGAAIAVAMNPKAKILLCDDASLLDGENLKVLHEMCKGFQVWEVFNDTTGDVGFFIEDGSLRQEVKA